MFVFHSLVVPVMWGWRRGWYGDTVYALGYWIVQLSFVGVFGWLTLRLDLPTANGFLVLCEQTRMGMKMHAFYRESIKTARIQRSGEGPKITPETDPLTVANSRFFDRFEDQIKQYFFFHFSPTLIYRNAYPRSRKVATHEDRTELCDASGAHRGVMLLMLFGV